MFLRRWRGTPVQLPVALAVGALLLHPHPVQGQTGTEKAVSASECCVDLLLPLGARAVALRDAISARSAPDGLFINPGALGRIVQDEFLVYSANNSVFKSNTFSLLLHSAVAGTFGLSFRLIDLGEQDALGPGDVPIGTLSTVYQLLVASYGTELSGSLSLGINYKLYQFRSDCRGFCSDQSSFSATTHGIDAGIQLHPRLLPALQAGVSLTNIGFPLQVVNEAQADPMPTRLHAGVAYELMQHFQPADSTALWLSVDITQSFRSTERPVISVGAELALEEALFLWAGYGGGTGEASGPSVGVGVHYDRFDVAVAKAFTSATFSESDAFQITFGVRF